MVVVLVVIAVLAAIALPSYRNHIIKTNRSAAQQFMSDVSNREEQFLLDQRSYTNTIVGAGGLNVTPPSDVAVNYTFAAATTGNDCLGTAVVAPAYVITATAIGTQSGDGDLCLDNRGNKIPAAKWAR
jgi:type IV pilus assembly protein PilE